MILLRVAFEHCNARWRCPWHLKRLCHWFMSR